MGWVAEAYRSFYDWAEGDHATISVIGSMVSLTLFFWIFNLFFIYTDLTGRPKWMHDYKVQDDKNFPVDMKKFRKAVKTIAFNNIVLNSVIAYPFYMLQTWFGTRFDVESIPSGWEVFKDLLGCALVVEVTFYVSHRLMHHPFLYKAVHKKHHEWTAPIGIVSLYATPFEYLTGNAATVVLGPLFMKSHIVTVCLWYSIAMASTSITHSGYHLPFMSSPQFHDYHHYAFNNNYGSFGLLDWLLGTDKEFRKTVNFKRHFRLWGFTPIKELVPDTLSKSNVTSYKKNGYN